MDKEVRKRALARLVQSKTVAAQETLEKEFGRVAKILETETEYDVLAESLDRLAIVSFRFSNRTLACLQNFTKTIGGRNLKHSRGESMIPLRYYERHSNPRTLIQKAMDVVVQLRYYETTAVLHMLLDLANHSDEVVRKKASEGLSALAEYNLDVFYGPDRKGGIGAQPQKRIVEALETADEVFLCKHFEAILKLLSGVVSPTIEGTSWSSESITISRGQVPAVFEVLDVRTRAIQLLKKLYFLATSTLQKTSTISCLNDATRIESTGQGHEETRNMVAKASIEICDFYNQLVTREDLQVVQKIEHDSYWIFVHATSDDVRTAALRIEKALAGNSEYQIYRTLVGYEGIFGDWSALRKNDDDWTARENERRSHATEFARAITPQNYQEWRNRILIYARTESSDLAAFPIFYHFLNEFATARPDLALRLIAEDTQSISRFLIPLLRGIWDGGRQDGVRELINRWIDESEAGKEHFLFASVKLFLSTQDIDLNLLDHLFRKAVEIGDATTIRQCVTVALGRYQANTADLKNFLLEALDALTLINDARWIFDAWFRAEARQFIAELDGDDLRRVFQNLHTLPKIDHHAEEILAAIAKHHPQHVIEFFCDRIRTQHEKKKLLDEFEAVPFKFYKLQGPLSATPSFAVRAALELYRSDESLFVFRGARLLANIFPTSSPRFEDELLKLIHQGERNFDFVLGILRNYHGEQFVRSLCREIVKSISFDSPLRTNVAIALEATGVVYGEFGMSEAYERKREEVLDWLTDPNENVRDFAEWYIKGLERRRDDEKIRAEEEISLRKFHYGEN